MIKKVMSMRQLGRRTVSIGAAMVAGVILAACAGQSGVSNFNVADCKMLSNRAEAKINWARVPERELRVRDGEYSPMVMRLKQGRPYIIRIRNRDDERRVFRAPSFFEQNAVVTIGVEGERAATTCVNAISIPARQTAEVRVVAITDGTFEFEDNAILLPYIMSAGPSGVIVVEERRETARLN